MVLLKLSAVVKLQEFFGFSLILKTLFSIFNQLSSLSRLITTVSCHFTRAFEKLSTAIKLQELFRTLPQSPSCFHNIVYSIIVFQLTCVAFILLHILPFLLTMQF
jgi:hypothetical protein